MSKRIISLLLTIVILAGSIVSATAAIDTTGLVDITMPTSSDYYTGESTSIRYEWFCCDSTNYSVDAEGNVTSSNVKGGDRYFVSKIAYNLGDKFEVSFKTNSDNQNPNSNNRIVYQLGDLAVAFFSYGSGTNDNHGMFRFYYGADIASIGGSGISYTDASDYLIGETEDIGISTHKAVIGFDNGTFEFEVYNDDTLVYELSEKVAEYDFSNVKPAVRVYKRSSVWDNGLYFSSHKIMANLDGESVTQSIAALDIDALTYDNIIAVSALRNWYDSLDEAEQANVTNYADLEALEAKIPVLVAENFNETIGAIVIDDLKLTNKSTIEGYRAEYEGYSDAQKALVTNIDNLVAAEAEILRLVILKNDTDAANIVNNEILAMGEITFANYLYVSDARKSYETLTAQGKTLVADYSVLTAAEDTVADLRKSVNFRMVTNMVAEISETVTMADNDAVFNALGAYSMLSTAEKRLVENIQVAIDAADLLIKLETENNTLISPKIVSLELIGQKISAGWLPNAENGRYTDVPDGVTVYAGDTVKPGVYWENLLYNVTYNEDGSVASYTGTGTCYNITTGGNNWWGNNMQPLSNGACRNVSVGTLNLYHSNNGIHIAQVEVYERPTYEYNELFDVSMNVRTMIEALPREYSKLTEDDRYLVESANEALDTISVFDLDEVHNVRYLINCEKVLNGATIEDEENVYESNITGDITKDFVINSLDLLSLQLHILNINQVIDADRCDLNNDDVVDSADLVALQMYIVGLSSFIE